MALNLSGEEGRYAVGGNLSSAPLLLGRNITILRALALALTLHRYRKIGIRVDRYLPNVTPQEKSLASRQP